MRRIGSILSVIIFAACSAFAETPLEKHVRILSAGIGNRNCDNYASLDHAADYIRSEFAGYGYIPEEQSYEMEKKKYRGLIFRNIIATKEGSLAKNKVIIVCAHYDTCGRSPGADDNSSGVASALELSRRVRCENFSKTVKFVMVPNEELDLVFEDRDMGSYRYAQRARQAGEDIEAVICLDMIGYYTDKPGSQHMPAALKFFYPDVGNFVGVCSDIMSYDLVLSTIEEFKKSATVPYQYIYAPVFLVPELMASDHRSFWAFGYKSVWVTDTCIYRNPFMHQETDTKETVNYENIQRVTESVYNLISKLARQ